MDYTKRASYIVIKDFEYPLYLPLDETLHKYRKGDKVTLRVNGKVAKDWLEKGYIELAPDL